VEGLAEGFVEGFAVGYAVSFMLAALGPVGAVIGLGLLLYSAYQIVTNWDRNKALPPGEKARLVGGLVGGIVGGGLGGRAGARETVEDLPPQDETFPEEPITPKKAYSNPRQRPKYAKGQSIPDAMEYLVDDPHPLRSASGHDRRKGAHVRRQLVSGLLMAHPTGPCECSDNGSPCSKEASGAVRAASFEGVGASKRSSRG
jgi:hypothetical protein